MHIQINIDIQNADAKALTTALAAATLLSDDADRIENPQTITPVIGPEVKPPMQAPAPAAPADDGFSDGDGFGQTFAPDTEPAAESTPEPEPAASTLTLDEVRKRFTEISRTYPGARQKVTEILVEAGARNLPTLAKDKYVWALNELETWAQAQTA